ncbi:acyl-CoA-binding protein homolog [Bacillus rossius redtenbacheri]|uniref:acyl-CoA-binding protein homolog n=1 Tax=Bacillus rossius redtenbacheri TaxID=93214 RepID=UPI002FDC95F0
MSLDERFNKAAEDVKGLTKRPTDQQLLDLYGLFKQATVGDNETSKPGLLDLKGRAKWEAWNGRKGTSQEDAKEQYVSFASSLLQEYA